MKLPNTGIFVQWDSIFLISFVVKKRKAQVEPIASMFCLQLIFSEYLNKGSLWIKIATRLLVKLKYVSTIAHFLQKNL